MVNDPSMVTMMPSSCPLGHSSVLSQIYTDGSSPHLSWKDQPQESRSPCGPSETSCCPGQQISTWGHNPFPSLPELGGHHPSPMDLPLSRGALWPLGTAKKSLEALSRY